MHLYKELEDSVKKWKMEKKVACNSTNKIMINRITRKAKK